jgi:hypothetical protein
VAPAVKFGNPAKRLMSVREGAPYADALDEVSGMLTYEGDDERSAVLKET